MRIFIRVFATFFTLTGMACSSKLIVKSDPSDAQVYAKVYGSDEKKSLGETPLTLTEDDLNAATHTRSARGDFYEIYIEKQNYQSQKLLIPISHLGSIESELRVKLPSGAEVGGLATQMVQHLVNAQKFTAANEFERAQLEIDQALKIDENFSRALYLRGTIYYLQHHYEQSLTWFDKALKLDPNFEDAVKMITSVHKVLNDKSPIHVPENPTNGGF